VRVVVKVGGGLLGDLDGLRAVAAVLDRASPARCVLVVPGGGPFADAVRELDARLPLGDDAAHWMAVLGMEQYAVALATLMPRGRLVETREEIERALDEARVPLLLPCRWLRDADPLPHSWEVTSDSIAAWVAGELGARLLVVVKPGGADVDASDVVDPHFRRALGPTRAVILEAHRVAELTDLLAGVEPSTA
jgi:aspartokinase-like uncharacterized kinase